MAHITHSDSYSAISSMETSEVLKKAAAFFDETAKRLTERSTRLSMAAKKIEEDLEYARMLSELQHQSSHDESDALPLDTSSGSHQHDSHSATLPDTSSKSRHHGSRHHGLRHHGSYEMSPTDTLPNGVLAAIATEQRLTTNTLHGTGAVPSHINFANNREFAGIEVVRGYHLD